MLHDLNRFHREATAGNSKIVELYFRAILPITHLLSLLTCPPALRKGRPLPHIALKISTLGGRIVAGITATPTYLRERNITPKRSKKYQTHHLRRVKFSVSRPLLLIILKKISNPPFATCKIFCLSSTSHHSFYREDYSVASIAFLKFKRTVHSHYQKSIEWIRIHQSRVAVEFMVACHALDINAFAITGNTAPASQNGQWGRGNNQRRCEQA